MKSLLVLAALTSFISVANADVPFTISCRNSRTTFLASGTIESAVGVKSYAGQGYIDSMKVDGKQLVRIQEQFEVSANEYNTDETTIEFKAASGASQSLIVTGLSGVQLLTEGSLNTYLRARLTSAVDPRGSVIGDLACLIRN